jgi:hypothetical protein
MEGDLFQRISLPGNYENNPRRVITSAKHIAWKLKQESVIENSG